MNYALIFAGGVGERMHTNGVPKQFLEVFGKPIICYTLEHFQKHKNIDEIAVVCVESHLKLMYNLVKHYEFSKVKIIVKGGKTGQESIKNGLLEIYKIAKSKDNDIILIHDGVRPIIDEDLITKNIETVKKYGNAITSSYASETCCLIENNKKIKNILPRDKCIIAKAPQSFYIKDIVNCHKKAIEDNITNAIDSADLMIHYGYNLHYIICSNMNIKITTPIDYYLFKGILNALESMQVIGI